MTPAVDRLRLLIVEDSAADAELVVLELERAGMRPDWKRVASARELEAALATATWDVVVSDYGMHGFDAPQALVIVRAMAPDLPFIVVSGSVGEELAVDVIRAGAQDFFLKDRLDRLAGAIAREVVDARLRHERQEALERLRVSDERLRALVSQAIVGITQTDLDGRFTLVNERFGQMAGRSVGDLVTMAERDILHPADVQAYEELLVDARAGARLRSTDRRYVRPDGQELWARTHVSVLRDADGAASALVTIVDDITERRRIEVDRERLMTELERTVRTSEMFVGVLGHDLRSPLQTITVAATLLTRAAGVDHVAVSRKILHASDRMRRMIEQLLDLTQMRLGTGVPLVMEELDLAELARHAVEEIVVSPSDEVTVLPEGATTGQWDRDRLLQLVGNLVTNALAHRERGSPVTLQVDGRGPDRVRLEVHNRGAIPEEILPGIFEPLQATKRPSPGGSSGLGLGLYIARQIARAHGGTLAVRSTGIDGTTFVADLPRRPHRADTALAASRFDVGPPVSGKR
jgi:PAS domain S-box-containing protein